MDPRHFTIIAGRDLIDRLDAEKAAAPDLCRCQEAQAARGIMGAELVQSMFGWSVRYDSGLQGWGLLASSRSGTLNGSYEAARNWALKWAMLDPERRYVFVRVAR